MEINEIWESAKVKIRDEVTSVSYDLWIKTLTPESFNNGTFVLLSPTTNSKNMVLKSHIDIITSTLKKKNTKITQVLVIDPVEKEINSNVPKVAVKEITNNFNPKFTFDNFIVGKSNEFVYAAAHKIAENPSSIINPFFLYGGSGLGKTHILNAIGNHLEKSRPDLKVILVTCEKFTNDYLETLNNKDLKITAFREKYRSCDVLLLDDMQFISKKISTQEEFFHTFNDLFNLGKQIVITSDRHPNEIKTLEERMRSRFVSGLVQDIQNPDIEMRTVIIKKKIEQNNYKLNNDVVDYIAEQSAEKNINIRDMEGMINKVVFYSSLINKKEASVNDAIEALKENIEKKQVQTTCEIILQKVCQYFNVTKDSITGKRRNKEFIEPRMITIYLITELLNMPLIAIGSFLGGRDHTTILHAKNKIAKDIKINKRIAIAVSDIEKLIASE
ncbi:MAG: chromosomal replication initiator protein DnaA [Firmicutes bacterium]|nr:chromosomal replication initiator protein DnaA [Bacillota bacterium]